MGTFKKTALALTLLMGLAVVTYGDTLYDISMGYYRLGEEFFKDDFGRGQNGINANFTFYHFPKTKLLGFFFRTAFGGFLTGYEWKGDMETESFDNLSASDLRICFAPAYQFNLGSRVSLPLALGPVFSIYWEENSGSSLPDDSLDYQYWKTYYEALNLGIMGDIAIVITPSDSYKWIFIKQGISFGCDFLHFEKGEMKMTYRHTRNARYNVTPYSALAFSVFFGIGVQFE